MFKFFKNKRVPLELDPVALAAANKARKEKENRDYIEKHVRVLREELTEYLKKKWLGERLIWYPCGWAGDHPQEALLEALSTFSDSYTFEVTVTHSFYRVAIEAK